MPIYEVHHSYPLHTEQKHELAKKITKLHSTTFKTPSFFVHVLFHHVDASAQNYYIAGTCRTTSTNRIVGQVRTSSARSKGDFDALAEKIELAWLDVVKGEIIEDKQNKNVGKRKSEVDESDDHYEAARLNMVSFYPMLAAREAGMVIPEAGKESEFYKEWRPYMTKMAEEKGLNDFKEMLKELDEREDLKDVQK